LLFFLFLSERYWPQLSFCNEELFDNANAMQLVDLWVHAGVPGLRVLSFSFSTSFLHWYQAMTDFSERSSVALQIWHPISVLEVSIHENQRTSSRKEVRMILSMEQLKLSVFNRIRYYSC
jgi:hypothetical protein